ncbi:multiple sugar transport system substrate-binding protein [Curtobacterium sp. PhB130]|uniref:ABC transporter substrate-binding protein n=1 Tax=unclassified Curtobacterium TaxID=257496 RepID=UPI000F4C3EA8|nr:MULTISPECIES: ABC transporter substrate-binding protein [unclassified Curtobacterium]ROS71839.1 multiple sugar transport system substrate-binding protein [Curtobacterium sp. PhB130]TCK58233.1 multiple sugar transport system substrate-binding protein [Curtobacterium sp. PhB136]
MDRVPHTPAAMYGRRSFLGLAGVAATAVLAGCASGSRQQAKTAGALDLDVWTNDPNYVSYFTERAKELTASRTTPYNLSISSLIQSPDQIVTKMLTSYMSGTKLPDIAGFEISQFSRLQRDDIGGDIAVDLRAEIPDLDSRFYTSRIVPYSVGDAVYGLESDMCLGAYFYREDLWKKFGLPTDFETWDDLVEIGAAAHKKHQVSVAAVSSSDIAWMAMLMLQQGGQFFDDRGKLQVDNPYTHTALELLRRGVDSGAFLSLSNFYGAAGVAALNSGQVIGYFMPDWFLPFVLQLNAPKQTGQWRIREFPRFPEGGPTGVWGGTGFGVPKDQAGTRAALDLLKQAYTTTDGQVQRYLQASYLPTMKDAWKDDRLLSYESKFLGGQRPFDVYGTIVDQAPTMTTSPYWDVMSARMVIALSDVMSGNTKSTDAVRDAAASIRSQMA